MACLQPRAVTFSNWFLERRVTLQVGKLGEVSLGPGRIRYYGSARGPGGVRARVVRHLRPAGRRAHWHVDALTSRVEVTRVMVAVETEECALVRRDPEAGRWPFAVRRIGSTDCRSCEAHLSVDHAGFRDRL